jgi:Uma2 family endonuclease
MTPIRQVLPHYTIEDYKRWEGRWEIIRGIAYAMSPMPSPKHQNLASKISRLFEEAIEKTECGHCKVYQPIDYIIQEDIIVTPDLLILCKPVEGHYLTFAPDLVAEILSPSTALKDRNTKYDLYQMQSIPYYLIIDPDAESLEVYRLSAEGKYVLTEDYTFLLSNCIVPVDLNKTC